MSMFDKIYTVAGGPEATATFFRDLAVFGASFYGFSWIGEHYQVEYLSTTPQRLIAAGIFTVGLEVSLRVLADEKAVHLARMRSSVRALQKELADPKTADEAAEILRKEAGWKITGKNLSDLSEGKLDMAALGSPQAEMLDDIYVQGETAEEARKKNTATLNKILEAQIALGEEIKNSNASQKELVEKSNETLKSLNSTLEATTSSQRELVEKSNENMKSLNQTLASLRETLEENNKVLAKSENTIRQSRKPLKNPAGKDAAAS